MLSNPDPLDFFEIGMVADQLQDWGDAWNNREFDVIDNDIDSLVVLAPYVRNCREWRALFGV